MMLSEHTLTTISQADQLLIPDSNLLALPEKVLQFGTGVLLRGLPDDIIHQANHKGIFNGRIVVVKSTDKGTTDAFARQHNLYTLCVRGLENGKPVDKQIINASISRVLSAKDEWEEILKCAANKDLKVIISNTTETGIRLVREGFLFSSPAPSSFPGKLVLFLYTRYQFFNGSPESGMVILPTELISDNGKELKTICIQLAEINHYESDFIHWLESANDFCNTLVDRIVPGALPEKDKELIEQKLGYRDELMIMAEPYSLWAIETTKQRTKEILSFATADSGIIITHNITKYKELKLRLLNATHTYSCAVALWCGFSTVKDAMENKAFKGFISDLIYYEIVPAITTDEISEKEAITFAANVLDRFANPYIAHQWISISAQYSSKMQMRCVKVLESYYHRFQKAPSHITLGFAAYLLFMNSEKKENNDFVTTVSAKQFVITDEKAAVIHAHWQKPTSEQAIHAILSDDALWGKDLTALPDFEAHVIAAVELLKSKSSKTLTEKELIVQ